MPREVRIRQIPDYFDGRRWHTQDQPIVKLGAVGAWAMVRRADNSQARPFVISNKEWDGLPASGMSAGTAETQSGSGLQPASPAPKGDAHE